MPEGAVSMGAHSYNRPQIQWYPGDQGSLAIGRYSSIHWSTVVFLGGEHRPDWVTTFALRPEFHLPGAFRDGSPRSKGPVRIGNDVYIGYRSIVLSGVTIGDGALVAAGSLVSSDVEPYAMVGGVPARFIRWRFEETEREALLRVRWWDWPDEKVISEVDLLCSPRIEDFLARHDETYRQLRGAGQFSGGASADR